jgi:hypothetical protein
MFKGLNSMIGSGNGRRLSRLLVPLTFAAASACAAQMQPPKAPNPSVQPDAPQSEASSGTVAYLRQLMDSHQLTQLRTTFNGDYGATLFFQPEKLSYYVAMFHGDVYWRVIQTDSEQNAESIYSAFSQQSEKLAEVDIDALRLKAGNTYAEQMVAMNQKRLQNLQADANRQQQQAQQVAAQQQQAQQQAVALSGELRNSSAQLDAVKERIRALEAQQANPEMLLPPPQPAAPSSASAPATPSS